VAHPITRVAHPVPEEMPHRENEREREGEREKTWAREPRVVIESRYTPN